MSAFMVSNDMVDAILTFAISSPRGWDPPVPEHRATEIGHILLGANARSVAHRYPGDGDNNAANNKQADAYRFKPWPRTILPIEVFKAIECLDYQSSEPDGWEESDARRMLTKIQEAAIRALPGYEDASECIKRPAIKVAEATQ